MRRIIVATFTSLDGVMQAPGGPEEDPTGGFALGGWTAPLFDEALGASLGEIFGRPFDLLLGRKTYDIFAAHWPYTTDPGDQPIAEVFNRVTKYVASRSKPKLSWNNSQLLGYDVVASLKKLKSEDGPDLLARWRGQDRQLPARRADRRRVRTSMQVDLNDRAATLLGTAPLATSREVPMPAISAKSCTDFFLPVQPDHEAKRLFHRLLLRCMP